MDLIKFNRYLEIFWWLIAAITLIIVVSMCFVESFDKWLIYLLVPALAVLMAVIRRFMGKRLAKSAAERQAKKK